MVTLHFKKELSLINKIDILCVFTVLSSLFYYLLKNVFFYRNNIEFLNVILIIKVKQRSWDSLYVPDKCLKFRSIPFYSLALISFLRFVVHHNKMVTIAKLLFYILSSFHDRSMVVVYIVSKNKSHAPTYKFYFLSSCVS